jgi:acetyltransferase
MGLDSFFKPQGIAVIGSAGEGKIAQAVLRRFIEKDIQNIYAVNPKAQSVGRAAGYSSVQAIGRKLDLAVIASPAGSVVSVLEDCGAAGVGGAVIISSGFSEAGNPQGEAELKAAARKLGIRFIGPNCAGLANTHANLAATLEICPAPGRIALVSQSGAVGGLFMSMAAAQRAGISKFVSYGNGADLSAGDFLAYLRDDPETDVIALYLESIRNGRDFMAVLKTVTAVKPVVVIKSGRTSTGQRATLSHTGAMAGSDRIFAAALDQCGALRAETLEEMLDISKGFAARRRMGGKSLGVLTNSGGPAVMAADRADELGLLVSETGEETRSALASFLPPHAGILNPVDLTVEGSGGDYEKALEALLRSYDAAIALYVGTPYLKSLPVAEGIIAAAARSEKPVFSVFDVGSDLAESLDRLAAADIPTYRSGERAATALKALERYEALGEKRRRKGAEIPAERPALRGEAGTLPEPEAMRLLNDHGIPSPPFLSAGSAEEAAERAGELGFPVVMKIVSPGIIHKSDAGGVILNIENAGDARAAFNRLREIAGKNIFNGVIIYPRVQFDRELILGISRDQDFGPVAAFGMGGIYTEVFQDVVFRPAPVDIPEALDMIRSIRSFPILAGSRGKAAADIDRLGAMLSNFSRLPFLYPEIVEADINPVVISPGGIYALDARIVTEKAKEE